MIKPITIAVIGLCAATATSFAQSATGPKSAADCQQVWTTADANKDGMLDKTELEANKAQMPSSLMTGSVTMPDSSTSGSTGSTTSGNSSTTTTGSADSSTTTGTTGSTSGSATGMMVSQQDFMTACTTGQ